MHMDEAYMNKYMDIHAQRRGRSGNNSHESDHPPTLATWTSIRAKHMLKEIKVFMKT